jgi:hypothetical protein
MTARHTPEDDLLDRAVDAVRRDELTDEAVNRSLATVWSRLESELADHAPLTGCDDYQRLIPELVAGRLSEGRTLLVEDHTRECLACRRVLMRERGQLSPHEAAPAAGRRLRLPRTAVWAAAAAVVIGLAVTGWQLTMDAVANSQLRAVVVSVDGGLQRLDASTTSDLVVGDRVVAGELLRTPRDASAFLTLEDGTVVEIAPRTEMRLRAGRRGTTIDLARGNVLVHAADQHGGRLYVDTDDCEVAVKGTIFVVNHGLRGSRVSVVEGLVEVRSGSRLDVVAPGEQVVTGMHLHPTSVADEVSWSRDAEQHLALLEELTRLERDLIAAADSAPARTSTRLLDLAPEDTVVFAAVPNLARGIADAREVFASRLADSATLRQWWQDEVVARGLDREVDELLDRLEPLGDALGDEIAVALPLAALDGRGGPLVLAELRDPVAFRSLVETELTRSVAELKADDRPVFVSAPSDAPHGAPALLWITGDVLAAAADADTLMQLESRLAGATATVESPLRRRLQAEYRNGASWLVGVDLGAILAHGDVDDRAVLDRLGLLDARTLVVEHHRDDDGSATTADLDFDGPRRGLAAWLAEPSPLGSLDYVSPQATFAAAAVTRDAADMLDDLLDALAANDPDGMVELDRLESEIGFDLRNDLAVALGGEGTVAQDGPLLPVPWWTAVLEVYDPQALRSVVERVVERANVELELHDQPTLEILDLTVSGRPAVTVRQVGGGLGVTWVVENGYLVAGPEPAAVAHALDVRASGLTLPRSATFRDLLPSDEASDCSAVVFRNLGALSSLVEGAAASTLPPEAVEIVRASSEPALYCVQGDVDTIAISGRGGSLLGAGPLSGLAMLTDSLKPVSSPE